MAPQIGDDHPDVAEALVVRGGIAFEEGRLADALADARHALAALERAYGRRHEATLKRRTDLASLLIYGAGDDGHSDAAYREAAALLADALDTGVRQGLPMGYARDEYANALLHLGRVDEADLQARLGIAETKALFGADTGYAAINYMVLMEVDTRRRDHDAADDLGAWLLAQCEPEDTSSYTRFLIMTALLENAVGRGDAERIRSAYRDVARFARRHGFEQALDAIDVPAALRRG
jgi:tetratricopeptide (TPR) repeat protein